MGGITMKLKIYIQNQHNPLIREILEEESNKLFSKTNDLFGGKLSLNLSEDKKELYAEFSTFTFEIGESTTQNLIDVILFTINEFSKSFSIPLESILYKIEDENSQSNITESSDGKE